MKKKIIIVVLSVFVIVTLFTMLNKKFNIIKKHTEMSGYTIESVFTK